MVLCSLVILKDGTLKLVHPGLLWVKLQSPAVKVDRRLEVFPVSIAAHAAFDGHDFAVDALGHRVGDPVRAVADNIRQTLADCPGHLLQRRQFGVDDPAVPVLEVFPGGGRIVVLPQVAEHLFVGPRLAGGQLQMKDFVQF